MIGRRGALAGVAGLCLGREAGCVAALLGLLPDLVAAAMVGRAARAAGVDGSAAALWGELAGVGALRARFAGRVAADFAAGRVVWVGGWMLSVCEARLYAMAAGVALDGGAAGA